ncbi:hypothetical protein MTR67_027119 [Solanum verrucosum]|uniref:Uncharacterized protein n=1 Tax=Solanum verrucosum TaxID=315347 RepID=A0AAF0R062_SOLVR|nr:hypothetical protein MTR67_027119 [Solanum verrucosum]
MSESIDTEPFEELSSLSKSQSLSSIQQQELTVDDIEDFDDDDDLDEVDSRRYSRRVFDDAVDLVVGLSSFATGKHGYYRMLKKFWSFLSSYGVFWESQKPSTTRAMLGYYFDKYKMAKNNNTGF